MKQMNFRFKFVSHPQDTVYKVFQNLKKSNIWNILGPSISNKLNYQILKLNYQMLISVTEKTRVVHKIHAETCF